MSGTTSSQRGVWSISQAKANFAAFLKAAERKPQTVTVRGVPKVEIRLLPGAKKSSQKNIRKGKK
jgi:prevent-host-death family protein